MRWVKPSRARVAPSWTSPATASLSEVRTAKSRLRKKQSVAEKPGCGHVRGIYARGGGVVKADYRNGVRISTKVVYPLRRLGRPTGGEDHAAERCASRCKETGARSAGHCERSASARAAHAVDANRRAERRSQFYDFAGARAGGDSGVLAAQAAADRFADQQQNGIFARGSAAVSLYTGKTGIRGLGR